MTISLRKTAMGYKEDNMAKIMIVDDSVSIRKSVSFVLSQEGYEVIEADDGIDGLKKS